MNEFQAATIEVVKKILELEDNVAARHWAKQIVEDLYEDDPTEAQEEAMSAEFERLKLDI